MNRRDWIALASSAALRADVKPDVAAEIVRLKLKHTWTTTMSSSEFRDTLHFRYTNAGDRKSVV